MKLSALLVMLSFSALAGDYTLYQAENHHFRDYSRAELMQRLGESSRFLVHYVCNGINEHDLLWPAIRQNESGDSLKINLYKSSEQIIYKKGHYFNLDGSPRKDLSDTFVVQVVSALKKIEGIPEGAKLLRQLERSHFPLNIAFGGNMFNPKDDAGTSYRGIYRANILSIFDHGRMTSENIPFNDIGAGGTIAWNPKTPGLPSHVALIHEMYHAFDAIRGILDMRFVHGAKYEAAFVSEYRAVYFENLARKAAGVEYRTHYGEDQSGPGLLDENSNPRKMPSPCL